MKQIYAVFPWVGNSSDTIEFVQDIFENMLFTRISKAEAKRRELHFSSKHIKTFRFLVDYYPSIFVFTEEEFELIYLPLCSKMLGYYEVDFVEQLTKQLEEVAREYRL